MGILKRMLGGKHAEPEDPHDFRKLVDKALNHLGALTSAHDGAWRLSEAEWSVDQEIGTIVFTTPGGIQATAPVQIIGTYDTHDGTWLWGWDHPSVVPGLAEHATRMLDYGRQNSVPALTTRKLRCSEDRCWELTAVACLVCEAQGAYRGPSDTTMVFMTFGEVSLSKRP